MLRRIRAWFVNRDWPLAELWKPEWDRLITKPPTVKPFVVCERDATPHTFNWHGHRVGPCENPTFVSSWD